MWRPDGSELLYVDHEHLLQRVDVRATQDGGLALGRPERVFVPPIAAGHWGTTYDVSPDGGRVFMMQMPEVQAPNEMTIVLGWRALLE